MKKASSRGFTLAEVLITLSIIGIVAAITLPSLLINVNEKAWDAQRKALHARLAQAIGQMNTLSGFGTFALGGDDGTTVTEDTAAETFILNGLSKVYKISNTCGPDKLSSCGLSSTIVTLNSASEIDFPKNMEELNPTLLENTGTMGSSSGSNQNTSAAAFETANGESVAVYYNPFCGSDSDANHYVQNKMCVNFIYDLNGSTGPNQVGKDIGFITAFYRKSSVVVAPVPYTLNATSAPSYSADAETLDAAGSCKAMDEDARLPDRDELASMYVNGPLMGVTSGLFWSGSVISPGASGLAWHQYFDSGHRPRGTRSHVLNVRCVRR